MPGLADGLVGRDNDLQVLLVHGMGSPAEGYSATIVDGLARRLGLASLGSYTRLVIEHGSVENPATMRVMRFRSHAGRMVTLYELTWSPLIDGLKNTALAYDWSPQAESRRSLVNRALKRELMDRRLADPILYLGGAGSEVRYATEFAICNMIGGRLDGTACVEEPGVPAGRPPEVAIVAESLGSKVAFDALTALGASPDRRTQEAAESFAQRTAVVYLLANQLPLLGLAELGVESAEEAGPAGGLDGFLTLRESVAERGIAMGPLQIVAFSDPNDLLSYEISPEFAARYPEASFVNVRVGIAGRGLFKLVANPLRAHTGHSGDRRVMDALAGAKAP